MQQRRRRVLLTLAALSILVAGYAGTRDYFEAAAFVIRAAGLSGAPRRLASLEADRVHEAAASIPARSGPLRARTYTPDDITSRPIVLVPGVHAAGIDEPRLVNFAREIAATGHPVVTAELIDLTRYAITPRTTDMIEDAAAWAATAWTRDLRPGERAPGLMGISFGGGLSVVAASRMGGRIGWVLSFGGHGDLPRTLRYLCTGILPDGGTLPPHDYGVVIILLGVAERVVPEDQVAPLRRAILTFLNASHLDMIDKQRGAAEFDRAKTLGLELPEPARTYMAWVNARDVRQLGPALLPHVSKLGGDAALSPSRNPPPSAPVYLLHGLDDNVIPAAEARVLAAYLHGAGGRVTQLSTALITHAEVDRPPALLETWRLVRFWAGPI